MEGLRKGSLFPFLRKQGRGERSVLPLPRASGGQPAGQGYLLLVAVPTCRASGFRGGVSVFSGRVLEAAGSASSCIFCLLPGGRWAICPCAPDAAPCREARYRGRPCSASVIGMRADPFRPQGATSRCLCSIACRAGCPGGQAPVWPGGLGKSGFSGREQKSIAFCSGLGYGFSIVCGKWRHGAANPSRNQP